MLARGPTVPREAEELGLVQSETERERKDIYKMQDMSYDYDSYNMSYAHTSLDKSKTNKDGMSADRCCIMGEHQTWQMYKPDFKLWIRMARHQAKADSVACALMFMNRGGGHNKIIRPLLRTLDEAKLMDNPKVKVEGREAQTDADGNVIREAIIAEDGEDFFHPEKGVGYLIAYLDKHAKDDTHQAKKARWKYYTEMKRAEGASFEAFFQAHLEVFSKIKEDENIANIPEKYHADILAENLNLSIADAKLMQGTLDLAKPDLTVDEIKEAVRKLLVTPQEMRQHVRVQTPGRPQQPMLKINYLGQHAYEDNFPLLFHGQPTGPAGSVREQLTLGTTEVWVVRHLRLL